MSSGQRSASAESRANPRRLALAASLVCVVCAGPSRASGAEVSRHVVGALDGLDVVLELQAGRAETDERACGDLFAEGVQLRRTVLARDVTAAVVAHGAIYAVDRARALVRLDVAIAARKPATRGGARELDVHATPIFDRVLGTPAVLGDGALVVSRLGDEPGESDLWLVPLDAKAPPHVLFAAPGADDRPAALDDGRVLFVSTRSTVASLWIGDVAKGEAEALTNAGLVAGRGRAGLAGFVPPPNGVVERSRTHVVYDAGDGWWSVELATGRARRVSPKGGR